MKTTTHHDFLKINGSECLFSVNPGIPLDDAMNMMGSFMCAASAAAQQAANGDGGDPFAAIYLIEMARAIHESVIKAVEFGTENDAG